MTDQESVKVLVIGATGMLGNALLRFFAQSNGFEAAGSVRSAAARARLPRELQNRVIEGIDVEKDRDLERLFAEARPDVAINAVGLVKQLAEANDPLSAIPINALLPHRIAKLCEASGTRFVHISTDCVFNGRRGVYRDDDQPDAEDLYGRSKFLGEVDRPHAITLRTSIIGHELNSAHGLIEWFLAQPGPVNGYTRAIFSGLPTVELARVIRDFVIPRPELHGLYQVSAAPINKADLLALVANAYGKAVEIVPSEKVVIDRSLDSSRFRTATGYAPPSWPELVQRMKDFG
jgi:dTDP-4-dehydrorhamnose reductase